MLAAIFTGKLFYGLVTFVTGTLFGGIVGFMLGKGINPIKWAAGLFSNKVSEK